jgi:uncharacterized protein with GYD domain
MPHYVTLVNWTDQGIRHVKDSPKRAEAFEAAVKAAGGTVKDVFLVMGAHDLVLITELPNDEAMAKLSLTVGALGNVRPRPGKRSPGRVPGTSSRACQTPHRKPPSHPFAGPSRVSPCRILSLNDHPPAPVPPGRCEAEGLGGLDGRGLAQVRRLPWLYPPFPASCP